MQLEVRELGIAGVKLLNPPKFGDDRGFFSEVYSRRTMASAGIDIEFVQDNHSLSSERGTVRGLHFQLVPFAQDKLVRVVRGAIFDVAVDLRRKSVDYGRYVGVIISAESWNQILIPAGFAHGFMTIEKGTEVLYKTSNFYSVKHERGVLWNDPDLAIEWPQTESVQISVRDREWPSFREIGESFV